MARVLDLNTVERPTLTIILQDDARTRVDVSTPTEGLINELNQIAPQLNKITESPDEMDGRLVYDLAARLMSCNRGGVTITAEDLAGKYHANLETLLIFFGAYIDFINEVTRAKN